MTDDTPDTPNRTSNRDASTRSDCFPLERRDYLKAASLLTGISSVEGLAAADRSATVAETDGVAELDPGRFTDPPATSRPTVLWFWGGTMSEERIAEQLADMRSVGVRDFILFPRANDSPMEPTFFTEAWFDRVGYTIEEAKAHDMTLWLFNDDYFPSGRAGSLVVEGGTVGDREYEPRPDLRSQYLTRTSERVSGPETVDVRELASTVAPSALQVDDGHLLVDGEGNRHNGIALLNRGEDWTDYRFSFNTRPLDTGGTSGERYAQVGWVFRAQGTGTAHVWLVGNYPHADAEGGNLTKLTLVDGERRSLEIEPLPFDVRADEWYRVETVVDGDRIVTSVNNSEVDITESDATAAGTVGFREVGMESARYDDVRVETLDGDLLFESSFDDASALDAFARSIDPADVVGVSALPLRDGEPSLDGVVDLTDRFEAGETWSAPDGEFLVESYVRQHHGGTYLDLMSGEAVGRYLDVVHGEYYRRFGDEFGSTVRGFWDDEPVLAEFGTAVPWSPSLPVELESLDGDPATVLPALFRDGGEDGRARRELFWRAVSNRFADGYFRTQGEWAAEHDVGAISNPWDHSGPAELLSVTGDLLKDNQWFQVPGMDAVYDQAVPGGNLIAPRYASSSAHQEDRPRVLSENLGAYGWDVTPELARFVTGYMALRGANLTTLHAYWSNPDLIYDPPPIQPENTWWFAMEELVEWTGRVMEANRGEAAAETALLQPQRAVEAFQGHPEAAAVDAGFRRATFALENEQVDFDFLDESSLDGDPEMAQQAAVRDGALEFGPQRYQVVVVPPTPMASLETVRKLADLVRSGGTVIAVGRLPTVEADGRDVDLRRAVRDLFGTDPTDPERTRTGTELGWAAFAPTTATMREIAVEAGAPAVSLAPTPRSDDVTVLRRTRGDDRVFLLMNEADHPVETTAEFPVSGVPERWNPDEGATRTAVRFHLTDAGTAVPIELDPFEVAVVAFRADGPEPSQVPHLLGADLDVESLHQVDAETLSTTVRAESPGETHLVGRRGGRVYSGTVDVADSLNATPVDGTWRFRFDRDGATWRERPLGSWTDLDPAFSGTSVYETTVSVSDTAGRGHVLDLGRVADIAEVEVNGTDVGTLTHAPYRVDVTDVLVVGRNRVRVAVTNTNANEHGNTLPSGLFGPVSLDPYRPVETDLTLEPGGRAVILDAGPGTLSLLPEQTTTVDVRVTNLLRRPADGTVRVSAEGPVEVAPSETTLRLGKRETRTVEFNVSVPASAVGGEYDLEVRYRDEVATVTVSVPPLTGVNLARYGAAHASSTASEFSPSDAINGNANSADWASGNGWNDGTRSEFPDWIEVSFPVPLAVDRVDVFTLDTGEYPVGEYGIRDYDVEALVDGEYRTVTEVRDNEAGHVASRFSSVRAEAVRLMIRDSNDGRYSRVVELRVTNEG